MCDFYLNLTKHRKDRSNNICYTVNLHIHRQTYIYTYIQCYNVQFVRTLLKEIIENDAIQQCVVIVVSVVLDVTVVCCFSENKVVCCKEKVVIALCML